MTFKVEPDETELHRSRGQELVTTKRLVLGRKSWRLEAIEGASLIRRNYYYMVPLTKDHIPGMTIAGGFFAVSISGPIWGQYIPGSPCLSIVALLLAIASLMYTLVRHPGVIYNIRLQLQNGDSQESRYTVEDVDAAERLISAIKAALAMKSTE